MSEIGAAAAQSYREHMKSKAERLGGGSDATSVDASDYSPPEKLYAGVKTGMRPVSRQARAAGGVVGAHARAIGGRAPRKAGGGLGTSYVNRNQKTANAEREGEYPNGGMKSGGRAGRAVGGLGGAPAITLGGAPRQPRKMGFSGAGGKFGLHRHSSDTLHSMAETETDPTRLGHIFDEIDKRSGRKRGGRIARAEGGYIPRDGGPNPTKALKNKTGSSAVETDGRPAAEDGRLGRASGGRVARQAGGPLATPLSEGMGGQGRLGFNYGPQQSMASKLGIKTGGRVPRGDGGRAKAHERYGHGPSCACPSCRKGKAGGGGLGALGGLGGLLPMAISELSGGDKDKDDNALGPTAAAAGKRHGGRAGRANGGAAPGPAENQGAVGAPSFKHRAPKGENAIRARTMAAAKERAKGGEVEKKVLAAHHAEHEAMHKGRARGGRSGKGKMSVNIVIAPGGANPMTAGDPSQNPQLAIKPPMPPPAPMPMPGAAPGGAPMPMPIPIPGAAGPAGPAGPPGMPPRARGGRAPKFRGEPEAGSGSGLGRLQKIAAYGHRSREGAGMRR